MSDLDFEEDSEVDSFEIDHIVSSFKVSKLEQISSLKWFEKSVNISKLYRVAAAESLLEPLPAVERVKESLMTHSKFDHMVRELITAFIWKDNVLKRLLEVKPEPKVAFPTYMVLYYEVMVHGIVQAMIYHGDTFNYLRETSDDLVEYCVLRLRKLLRPLKYISNGSLQNMDDDPIGGIKNQNRYIDFNIGSQCIATLRYVCENLDSLPLSVSTRIYSTHDLPVLITQLLHQKVWTKVEEGKTYKFNETDWQELRPDDPPLTKMECQVWLLLRQLMLNTSNNSCYHYSDYRKEQLTKLIKYLNDRVLDQLSVLVDLQRMLHFLHVRAPSESDKTVHNPLIVEITPLFQDQLVQQYSEKWKELAISSSKVLFYCDKDTTMTLAKAFSSSITSLLNTNGELHTCNYCMKRAANRCSQCKRTWYCSRSCQVQHWKVHKNSCSTEA
ncbi:hypothetical protein GE061_013509 [Apolygus lucorum]|uniref:MYND-type domain-containing protein n=1 Tax=Apolygus lucorum TaxID=248454 RepID=A0A8S9XP55_APOLU|nr:hypothetical protein GE061_013509 [Apolygus lucorum]